MAGAGIGALVLLGIMIALIVLIFQGLLMILFGATTDIYPYAIKYARITALGIPFFMFATGANFLVRADGAPVFSMVAIIVGAVMNTILDLIFIFVFQMGIGGAAWATVISQMISGLMLM